MVQCSYTTDYVDLEKEKTTKFECEERALTIRPGSYCLFHDESYHESHAEEVREKLFVKIKEYIDTTEKKIKSLKCIGYHIPQLIVEGGVFPHIVYFTEAKFHGSVVFNNVIFNVVDFAGTEFQDKAIFSFTNFFRYN